MMSKVFLIVDNHCQREYPEYENAYDASKNFAPNMLFVDAPDYVWPGWGFDPDKEDDERFVRPELEEGWIYDENGMPYNVEEERAQERKNFHQRTTNDTLMALRKIREGDKSYDWDGWLNKLDDYNLAIEETKNQPDYPLAVKYPKYPTRE